MNLTQEQIEAINRIVEERVRKEVEPLATRVMVVENKLDALIRLIEQIGGGTKPEEAKEEFDVLWRDKDWIDEERAKSLDRRKMGGRKI